MKFLDETTITVKSGDGGPGCVSFRREKYIPNGGPDGGNGGKGGDVIFTGDSQLGTLLDVSYHRSYKARRGEHGRGSNKDGKNADDVIIRVPVGTVIKDIDPDTGDTHTVYEIMQDAESYVAAAGGRGGKGNAHFTTSTRQTPKFAQPGEEGCEKKIKLELKLIADIGIIGLPNAGKSTLISKISKAKPKIADYPFTTLVPNLGVVKYGDYKTFVVADIPGLIRGAHDGHGLGVKFLKHIERTSFFIHLIDASTESEEKLLENYNTINAELKFYKEELTKRKQLIVFNKLDVFKDKEERIEKIKEVFKDVKSDLIFTSAVTGYGIKNLINKASQLLIHSED
jgi:GTP-binding protein